MDTISSIERKKKVRQKRLTPDCGGLRVAGEAFWGVWRDWFMAWLGKAWSEGGAGLWRARAGMGESRQPCDSSPGLHHAPEWGGRIGWGLP